MILEDRKIRNKKVIEDYTIKRMTLRSLGSKYNLSHEGIRKILILNKIKLRVGNLS